jgi:hypothetical protein
MTNHYGGYGTTYSNNEYIDLLIQAEQAQSRYHAIDIINRATKLREQLKKETILEPYTNTSSL